MRQATIQEFIQHMEQKIEDSYTDGVSVETAERLAGEFLNAQLKVSARLASVDLDARMRKSGVKAVRGAAYADAKSSEVKLTEAGVAAVIDTDPVVNKEQDALDKAEVERDELKRVYDVFGNAHIHFRSIAKGAFGG